MNRMKSVTFWLKAGQALALAVAVSFTMGATDASSRFNDLGHRMMCTCSCAQMLVECNHVGCPDSPHLRDELSSLINGQDPGSAGGGAIGGPGGGSAGGTGGGSSAPMTDKQILAWFSSKYGATVLAAPTTQGFDLVAWIAPFAVFAAALLGTILLIRHWSVTRPQLATPEASPEMDAIRERIRRETGADGGFEA